MAMLPNLFCIPTPRYENTNVEEIVLIAIKPLTVDVNSGETTPQQLPIPADTFTNIGDTLLCEFYCQTVAGIVDSNVNFQIRVDSTLAMDGVSKDFGANIVLGANSFVKLEIVGTLCGNGLIKWEYSYDEFNDDNGESQQIRRSGEFYCTVGNATNIKLITDVDDSGSNLEVTLAKAYLIRSTAGLSNFGTPENVNWDFDTQTLSWEWNDRNDPVDWLLQVQSVDGVWHDSSQVAGGADQRSLAPDIAALADDFANWPRPVRIIGVTDFPNFFKITFPGKAVEI